MEGYTMERTNETHVATKQYPRNARVESREQWQSSAAQGRSSGLVRQIEAGSVFQTIGGIGALVLGILGIIGLVAMTFGSIAAIAAGGALLIGGTALTARYSRLFPDTKSPRTKRSILRGLIVQTIAGVGAIALGILSLVGLASMTLVAVSALALGVGLMVASRASARLDSLLIRNEMESGESVSHSAMFVASTAETVAGLGAITLGILALSGVSPLVLSLIAMMAVGTATFAGGSWLVGVSFNVYRAPVEIED